MRLARLPLFASIGLMLCLAAGCYRSYVPTYGSPYGAPYGAPVGPPVQTLTPSPSYTPTFPQGAPGSVPTPADPSITPNSTFQQGGSGGNAPFYEPNSSSRPPYNEGVPLYPDAGDEVQFQQQSSPSPIAEDVNLREQGALEGAGATTSNVAKVPLNTAEYFAPLRAGEQPEQADTALAVATVTDAAPSPFAHDARDFRWLRGVARHNESTGSWSLIYSVNETGVDQYQGWLTLAADPQLSQLVPNAAYLIEGHVDPSKTDTSGKPVYRIQSVKPWHPSPTN